MFFTLLQLIIRGCSVKIAVLKRDFQQGYVQIASSLELRFHEGRAFAYTENIKIPVDASLVISELKGHEVPCPFYRKYPSYGVFSPSDYISYWKDHGAISIPYVRCRACGYQKALPERSHLIKTPHRNPGAGKAHPKRDRIIVQYTSSSIENAGWAIESLTMPAESEGTLAFWIRDLSLRRSSHWGETIPLPEGSKLLYVTEDYLVLAVSSSIA